MGIFTFSNMKAIVLLISNLSIVLSLASFIIEFTRNCSEYLQFEGDNDYVYLFREQQLTLMISHNKSYEIYTYPTSEMFTFQWPENLVNNQQMTLNWQEGIMGVSNFTSYHILCEPLYFATNLPTDLDPLTYKCPKRNRDWLIVSIGLILGIIIYGAGTAAAVISEKSIPRIIGRSEQVLSRSEEDSSGYYSETDQRISEDSAALQYTQTTC